MLHSKLNISVTSRWYHADVTDIFIFECGWVFELILKTRHLSSTSAKKNSSEEQKIEGDNMSALIYNSDFYNYLALLQALND